MAIGTKHATRFLVGADLVGKKHHSELTDNQVEASFGERQILCIRGLKRNILGAQRLRCELKHRGIDVRGDDLRPRDRPMHRPSDNTGAGSSLENAVWLEERAALGDELR